MHDRIVSPAILAAAVAFFTVSPASAGKITPISEVQRGSVVTVEGTVERILDEDEFRLADASGRIGVYIGPNVMPANRGDRVTVRGVVDDGLTREIYAREMVLSDGSVVTLDRRYD